ncbi:MAG: tetratricopeptide repeat protein [Elusimicrobia bacterium]|nr:tetratricopeptide repeat protein [Elusimicrobiota bacterium]
MIFHRLWAVSLACLCAAASGRASETDGTRWKGLLEDANAAAKEGRCDEAESSARAALAEAETFGPKDPRLAKTLHIVGVFVKHGDRRESESFLRRALKVRESVPGNESLLVPTLISLAPILQSFGRSEEAEGLLKRAVDIDSKGGKKGRKRLPHSLLALGTFYKDESDYAKAEKIYRRVLGLLAASPNKTTEATTLINLALTLDLEERYPEAEDAYLRAIALTEELYGNSSPVLASMLTAYSGMLARTDREESAQKLNASITRMQQSHRTSGTSCPGTTIFSF